jgi:ABC-type transport system involved in multi-copper enzyme maturation permease subunit
VITLVARSVGRIARPLCALLVVLVAFQIAVTAAAASFADAGDFDRLAQLTPAFIQQTLGPVLTSFDGMVTVGYFDALIVMLFVQVAIYLAAEPAGEIESSLVDLVLARPLPRHWLVTRSLLVMLSCIIALAGAMALGTWLGLWSLAPAGVQWPAPRTVLTFIAYLMIIAWCFGSASLAACGWARRRGAAQAVIAVAAVTAYLIDLLGMMWAPMRAVARISPFHYFHGSAILAGTADPAQDLGILGTVMLAGIVLAYWRFQKRDL